MKTKTLLLLFFGIIVAGSYILVANSLKGTEQIWLLTRAFGLIAFVSLSSLVIIGELRLLGFNRLFKLHCTIGVITFFIALLHGLSAVFDKFKWGTNLSLADFLGFNFSSKWLILLSLGTMAFYLIIFVALTSSTSVIKKLGFKNWKILHYLSYIVIAIVFVHSTMLGTDIKTSSISQIIMPAVVFLFVMATGLFAARLIKHGLSAKQIMALIAVAVIISAVAAYCSAMFSIGEKTINDLKQKSQKMVQDNNALEEQNLQLYYSASNLSQKIIDLQAVLAKESVSLPSTPAVENTTPVVVIPSIPREEDDERGSEDD
jgi:methionine sulfoxide reductase heme-binding subunit